MLILAVGLSGMAFQSGTSIPGADLPAAAVTPRAGAEQISLPDTFPPIIQLIFALLFAGFIIFWGSSLIKNANKKHLIRLAWLALGILVVFLLLPRTVPDTQTALPAEAPPPAMTAGREFDIAPLDNPPDLFVWIVAGLLAAIVLAALLFFALRIQRRGRASMALQQEVEAALREVYDGGDLRNIIQRCYLQMMNIVKAERGIERGGAITPREFEQLLEAKGVPAEPLRLLTELFERVRYGGKPTTAVDEQQAVTCLTAIRTACLGVKGSQP